MKTVRTEHPALTVGELVEIVEAQPAPVRRSSHVGNQPPHELLLATAFPSGIKILHVDTVQANDPYSNPHRLVLDNANPLIRHSKRSGGILATAATATLPDTTEHKDNEQLHAVLEAGDVRLVPSVGQNLVEFHEAALAALSPTNAPERMLAFFAARPDILNAVIDSAFSIGLVRMRADNEGKIHGLGGETREDIGVLGMRDETSQGEGLMLPLLGMMAADILISAIESGSDETIHLAGPDMVRYTRDEGKMQLVGEIVAKASAELGVSQPEHCYKVPDITGLARLVSPATHASQHQLLRTNGHVHVDLARFENEPTAGMVQ